MAFFCFFFFCIIQQGKLQRFVRTCGSKGGGGKKKKKVSIGLPSVCEAPSPFGVFALVTRNVSKVGNAPRNLGVRYMDTLAGVPTTDICAKLAHNPQKCWLKKQLQYDKMIHGVMLCNKKHLNALM